MSDPIPVRTTTQAIPDLVVICVDLELMGLPLTGRCPVLGDTGRRCFE
jgi:hypothetical protein